MDTIVKATQAHLILTGPADPFGPCDCFGGCTVDLQWVDALSVWNGSHAFFKVTVTPKFPSNPPASASQVFLTVAMNCGGGVTNLPIGTLGNMISAGWPGNPGCCHGATGMVAEVIPTTTWC